MQTQKGFTLFDLMVGIAIGGILLGLAVPGLGRFIAATSADANARHVWRAIAKARSNAVVTGEKTTFCGVNEKQRCVRDKIKTFLVFVDHNDNHRLDDGDFLIDHFDVKRQGKVFLRASNSRYINYHSDGYASPYGSVMLCHKSKIPRYTRRISVNASGRHYLAKDKNGDGIIYDAYNKAIDCG